MHSRAFDVESGKWVMDKGKQQQQLNEFNRKLFPISHFTFRIPYDFDESYLSPIFDDQFLVFSCCECVNDYGLCVHCSLFDINGSNSTILLTMNLSNVNKIHVHCSLFIVHRTQCTHTRSAHHTPPFNSIIIINKSFTFCVFFCWPPIFLCFVYLNWMKPHIVNQ